MKLVQLSFDFISYKFCKQKDNWYGFSLFVFLNFWVYKIIIKIFFRRVKFAVKLEAFPALKIVE